MTIEGFNVGNAHVVTGQAEVTPISGPWAWT